MRDKRLAVTINRPVKAVFEFVVNPSNTPRWIDGLVREEADEVPVREGTIYRPYGEADMPLGEFQLVEFEDSRSFTFHKLGSEFFTRYTFTETDDGTRLEYHAWAVDGDLSAADRFTPDVLSKLKAVVEQDHRSL